MGGDRRPEPPRRHPGAGLSRYEVRYGVGTPAAGEWIAAAQPELLVPGAVSGATVEVEVAVIDGVGNRSAVSRHTLTVDGTALEDEPRPGVWSLDEPEVEPELGEPDDRDFCEPFVEPGVFRDECEEPNAAMLDALAEPALSAQRIDPARPGSPGGYGISDQWGDHSNRAGVTGRSVVRGFRTSEFRNLKVGKARIILPWDIMDRSDAHRLRLQRWMSATRQAKLERLVSFEKRPEDDANRDKRAESGPSPRQYRDAILKFVAKYSRTPSSPYYVKYYTAWNEPNNPSQWTWDRPSRAASYFRNLSDMCAAPRRCAVAAGDMLDSATDKNRTWAADYRAALGLRARLWAWHPYRDGERTQRGRLDRFIDATRCRAAGCRQAEVWLTEANGVSVHPPVAAGRGPEMRSTAQTSAALTSIIGMGNHPSGRVSRLYVYQWMGDNSWDSGLFRQDGTCRPTYNVLRRRSNPAGRDLTCPATPN